MKSIHFILHHSNDADSWPFYQVLRKLDPNTEVRVFSTYIKLAYRFRWQLIILGYPKLLFSTLRTAIRSVQSPTPPSRVVVEEHLQIWPLILILLLRGRYPWRRPRLIFFGFLFTERSNWLLGLLRNWYFRIVLSLFDEVIVFSKGEHDWLSKRFPLAAKKFLHMHYGIGDHSTTAAYAKSMKVLPTDERVPRTKPLRIFTAGRSGRDYQSFTEALKLLDFPYTAAVICDSKSAFPDHLIQPEIRVLRDCYGEEYTQQMIESDVIIVALQDTQISSGQMVVMHGLACGKPVIVTETLITREYFQYTPSVNLIPPENPSSLADCLREANCMAKYAGNWRPESREHFENQFSIECFANRFFATVCKD